MIETVHNLPAGPAAAIMRAGFERAAAEGRMVILPSGATWSYRTAEEAQESVTRGATLATGVQFAR